MTAKTMDKALTNLSAAVGIGEVEVHLRGHSFDDHRKIVPALLNSMAGCGCWVTEQRTLSATLTQLSFEVQLRSVYDLYSGILSAGLELTRESHMRMSSLCTVRDHNPRQAKRRRIITVRLDVNFLEQHDSSLRGTSVPSS
jgi:hypothetical protein